MATFGASVPVFVLNLVIRMNTLALCLVIFTSGSGSLSPKQAILNHVNGLKAEIPKLKVSKDDATDLQDQLSLVQQDVEAGRDLLGLYHLLDAEPDLASDRYFAAKSAVAASGRKGFDREWAAVGRAMRPRTQRLSAAFPSMSAANRTLVQVATIQSGTYWDSGRLYGYNTTLENGLAYVGLAQGMLGYAEFCSRVPQAKPETPAVFGLGGDLHVLDRDILTALEKVSEKDRGRLIQVNASYKLAMDLNKRGWHEGALLAYARSARALANTPGVSGQPLAATEIREGLAKQLATLGNRASGSLPKLYTEMINLDLADGSPGGARRAAVVVNKVFPILARTSEPRIAVAAKKAKVRVTLVRWPYT